MTDTTGISPSVTANKIHNACDDCRARKLKCSGELTGCTRCNTDGIPCHYSPRKQMGRPRKRRREGTTHNQNLDAWNTGQIGEVDSNVQDCEANAQDITPIGSTAAPSFDLDLSDLISHGPPLYDHLYGPNDNSTDFSVDALQGIENHPIMNSTDQSLFQSFLSEETDIQSQVLSSTLYSADYTGLETNVAHCQCLPQLYTYLAAFQSPSSPLFPYSLVALKKTARFATEAVRCQDCSKEYATALQNSMLLGTLMNLVINEYRKLLDHIEEKSMSDEEKKMRIGDNSPGNEHLHTGGLDCPMGIDVELSGEEWKMLARKTVRKEIFGPGDYYLAQIILEMKERQRKWHFQYDGSRPQHVAKERAEHGKESESNACICVQGIIIDRLKQSLDTFGL